MPRTIENYVNDVFIPTVAEFPDDIATSWEIQKPLEDAGYRPGFMLFIRKTKPEDKPRVFDHENVKKQYGNLEKYAEQYGNAPVVTMLSNLPIQHIDFLHNSSEARDHVYQGIEFAKALPIGGRKMLTFHLNTLVTPEEFKSKSQEEWYALFDEVIRPKLKRLCLDTKEKNVETLVETVPVPEFGDIKPEDNLTYRGVHFRDLRNPFYLIGNNGAWNEVKRAGLGICLDVYHNRTIYIEGHCKNEEVLFQKDREQLHMILQPVDYEMTIDKDMISRTLLADVMELNPRTDLVHLNDGAGRYNPQGEVFLEGVALGERDIDDLKYMINDVNRRKIPFVIEVNETDFKERPNTKKSIEYLLSLPKYN